MADQIPDVQFEDIEQEEFTPAVEDEVEVIVSDSELEVEDESIPEEYRTLTKEDLVAKLSITEQQVNELKGKSSEAQAIQQGIAQLGEKLQTPAPQPAPQQPGETEEEYAARFNEQFFDSPYDMMKDFQVKKLGPEIQRVMQNNLVYAKRDIQRDPEYSETFKTYESEIEEHVQSLPPQAKLSDPDVYRKAHDAVIGRHWRDIIDQRVNEAITNATQPTKTGNPPPFVPTPTASPPPSGKKTIRLTREQAARAAKIGASKADYAAYIERKRQRGESV